MVTTTYIASVHGQDADWCKNICTNPKVHVQIRDLEFDTTAEPVPDPIRIVDFIGLRLRRYPIMIRLFTHLFDGLPLRFNSTD